MPHTTPACPQCGQENTYPDADNFICPDCAHEWPQVATADSDEAGGIGEVRDAHGTVLQDGDAVLLVKDLKVKGSSLTLKRGTMVKNIRLTNSPAEIEGRAGGSTMVLKTEFLEKA